MVVFFPGLNQCPHVKEACIEGWISDGRRTSSITYLKTIYNILNYILCNLMVLDICDGNNNNDVCLYDGGDCCLTNGVTDYCIPGVDCDCRHNPVEGLFYLK